MNTQELIAAARRRPLTAGGVAAGAVAGVAAALALTASAAAADAPLTGGVSGAAAPAGRVMGLEVDGFGRDARIHSVDVDEYGVPLAYTIRRAKWHGFGASFVTVAPDALRYLPREDRLAASADTAR